MNYKVEINKIIDNDKPLKATATVILDNMFAVHGVRVIESKSGLFVAMPYRVIADSNGENKRKEVFHPLSNDARLQLENLVLNEFHDIQNQRNCDYATNNK